MQMDYGVLPQAGGEPTYSSSNMAPFLTKLFQIVSGSTDRPKMLIPRRFGHLWACRFEARLERPSTE